MSPVIHQQKHKDGKIFQKSSLQSSSISKSNSHEFNSVSAKVLKRLNVQRSRKALSEDCEMPIGYQASPEYWQRKHGQEFSKREIKSRIHAPRVTGEVVRVGRFSFAEHGNNVRIFLDDKNIVSYNKTSLEQTQKALQFLQWNYGADAPIKILERISNDLQPLIPPEPGSAKNRINNDQKRAIYIRRIDPRTYAPRSNTRVDFFSNTDVNSKNFKKTIERGFCDFINRLNIVKDFVLDNASSLGKKAIVFVKFIKDKPNNSNNNSRNKREVVHNPNTNQDRKRNETLRNKKRDESIITNNERKKEERHTEDRFRKKSSMLDSKIASLSYTEFEHNGEYNGYADIFRSKKQLRKGYVLSRETLKADAVQLLKKAIANNEVPVFYQSSHGNRNTNNMTGYDSVWLEAIADAIEETGYKQPVIIENCHCHSGVRLLELNVLKRFPKGTILLKNQDNREAYYYEGIPQVPSASRNATLIDSLAYFSGVAIPDAKNNMTCAIVDNHGNPRLYSEDGSYTITTDLGVIKSERLPQKFSDELSNKIKERRISLDSSNIRFSLRCLEMSRMFQGLA